MAKIQIATDRVFKNVFICKKCGTKIRADPKKIIEKKVKCRKCKGKNFRQKKRK